LKEWLQAALGHTGRNDDVERKLKPYLRDGNACVILRLILENPGIRSDEMARRSGIDKTVVEGCLDGMLLNEIVTIEKEVMSAGYHVAGAAKVAVVEHLPLNYQCPGMRRE
jgi:hypothetical protein